MCDQHVESRRPQAGTPALSPEEGQLQEAKRRLYARIARGNALAEAEDLAQKKWKA